MLPENLFVCNTQKILNRIFALESFLCCTQMQKANQKNKRSDSTHCFQMELIKLKESEALENLEIYMEEDIVERQKIVHRKPVPSVIQVATF